MLYSLRTVHSHSLRYALACPWLFCLPIATEAMQHIAEYSQGFYGDLASARAAKHSMLRMGFGTMKIMSVVIARYWVIRWLEWGDRRLTVGFDHQSIVTFMPLLAFELAISLPTIWLPVFAPSLAKPLLFLSFVSFLLGLLFSDWSRTASIGQSGGPIRSARTVAPIFLWAFAFTLAALLPPMVVHYALMIGAMKAHGATQFMALTADAVFVGYLSAIISGVPWFVSERGRAHANVNIVKG